MSETLGGHMEDGVVRVNSGVGCPKVWSGGGLPVWRLGAGSCGNGVFLLAVLIFCHDLKGSASSKVVRACVDTGRIRSRYRIQG